MTAENSDRRVSLGVDLGTSTAKGALFAEDGTRIDTAERPLPPLETRGPEAGQPLGPVVEAAEEVLRAFRVGSGESRSPDRVALTTQRDTLVLLDGDGRPLTPLISWADRRDQPSPTLWHALASAERSDVLERATRARSLASYLAERWTGRAAETTSTLPRHLRGEALRALRELGGTAVGVPETVAPGAAVGELQGGGPLHQAGGDKNCELLGSGVDGPGRAGLSLGSAVSLGMLAAGRPGEVPGTVATRAAIEGRWNVETGIPAGMRGWSLLESWFGPAEESGDGLDPGVVVVPYFEGGLDRPDGRLLMWGVEGPDPAERCYRGWRQGVVAELRRLRPNLEVAAEAEVDSVRLSGGGSRVRGWARLVADALGVPVEVEPEESGWEGCRGAVLAALRREGPEVARRFRRRPRGAVRETVPDPEGEEAWERYADRYAVLARAAADAARPAPGPRDGGP